MNRRIGLIALLVSWIQVASSAAVNPPVRILPLGDSLTAGYSVPPTLSGYRVKLYTLLGNAGYNVDFVGTQTDTLNALLPDPNHEGHGGYRIDQIDSGIEGWLTSVNDPDVILLLIGTNDFYQNYDWAGASGRLENLVARISSLRPYAKILLANLPLQTVFQNPGQEAAQDAFNASIPGIVSSQVALGRQVSFVDIHSSFNASNLSSDGVHPKQSGYDKMATTWSPAITSVISPLGTADPPAIVRARQVDSLHVAVTFSKPVEDAAADVAHFSLNGGVTISQAVLDPESKRIITLTTSQLMDQVTYTLVVNGVSDRIPPPNQNQIAPGSTVTFIAEQLINGSFESADFAGWTASGNMGIAVDNAYPTTDGANVLVFNWGQLTPNGMVSQSIATTAGQTYMVQFDMGVLAYSANEQRLAVTVQGDGVLVSDTVSMLGQGGGGVAWMAKSYMFVANSATTMLTFQDVSLTSLNVDMLLDHVRVAAPSISNTAPAFTTDPITGGGATEDVAYSGTLAGSASDIDAGDTLTYALVGGPAWLLVASDGSLSGTPSNAEVGANAFTVRATDGLGAFDEATLNISVLNVNDAPEANAQSVSVKENDSVAITLTGSDIDGDNLTFAVAAAPAHGTLNLAGAVATYSPNLNYIGPDSFTFTVSDGMVSSAAATVSITAEKLINGSFEANFTGWTVTGNAFIESISPYTATDGSKLVSFNGNSTSDVPVNAVLSQSFATIPGTMYTLAFDMGVLGSVTAEQQLEVTVEGTGNLLSQTESIFCVGIFTAQWTEKSYAFVANSTTTTLTFRDVSPTTLNVDMLLDHVRVTVVALNSAPVADHDSYSTNEDGALTVATPGVLGNDTDPESSTLTAVLVTDVAHGTLVLAADGGFSYTPQANFNGVDSFTYEANDGTVSSASAMVTITVTPGNDAPVAIAQSATVDEDGTVEITLTGSDIDGDSLNYALAGTPAHGSVGLAGAVATYTPDANYHGPDSFTFTVYDGTLSSASAMVSITVTSVNDPPVAIAQSATVDEDGTVFITANR